MKTGRRLRMLVAFVIALALVIPSGMTMKTQKVHAESAPEAGKIEFGKASLENNVLSFPNAKITCATKIYSCTVTTTKGHIITGGFSNADKYDQHKSATWLWSSGKTADEVQAFVRGLEFSYKLGIEVQLSFDGSSGSNLPAGASITSFEHEDGSTHYYAFVHENNISWDAAYNKAKQLEYKGLRGYLATVTYHKEDLILDAITNESAWGGGARMNAELTKADLDKTTAVANNTADGPTNSMANTKWAWACGPEAGQKIRATKIAAYVQTDPTAYSNWTANNGVPVQPDSNTTNEWCLQLHHGGSGSVGEQGTFGWNDLPVLSNLVTGYFVEFSDYGNESHTSNYVEGGGTFAGAFSTHAHTWSFETYNGEIIAKCKTKSEFKGECQTKGVAVSLEVTDGPRSTTDSVKIKNYTDWVNEWELPAVSLTYKSVTNPAAAPVSTLPSTAGEYTAIATLTDGGDTYSITKNFTIYSDNTIEAMEGDGSHTHRWTYVEDGTNGLVYVTCTGDYPKNCAYKNRRYQIEGVVEANGDARVKLIEQGKENAEELSFEDLEMKEPTVRFILRNADGTLTLTSYGTAPKAAGKYQMQVICKNMDSTMVKATTNYEIKLEGGQPVAKEEYVYRYSGTGLDRSKGFLLFANDQKTGEDASKTFNFVKFVDKEEIGYDATHADLRNEAHNTDGTVVPGMYIDMYTGTFVAPGGFTVNAYKTAANGKWYEIKSGKTFADILPGLLKKQQNALYITNDYDNTTKKAATQYYFSKIKAPGTVPGMRACYDRAADDLGITNGQFVFMTTGSSAKVQYNIGNTYDVTFAEPAKKDPISWGWGVWPSSGGVWVPDSKITENESNGKKTVTETQVKYNFYIRTKASVTEYNDGTKSYCIASKEKKITVASIGKAPKIKVSYDKAFNKVKNRDSITIKKGCYAYFLGNLTAMPDPMTVKVDPAIVTDSAIVSAYDFGGFEGKRIDAVKSAVKLDITNYITETRNKILVWSAATASKPASAKQTIELAARKTISATSLPINVGKVKLKVTGSDNSSVQYEIYDEAKSKWSTSLPTYKVATEAAFTIRLKSNAKSGAEDDNMTAGGIPAKLIVLTQIPQKKANLRR